MMRPGLLRGTSSRPMRATSTQGESSRTEPASGLAGRCPGGAAHPIARRQERPTLSLLRLRCPDHRGRTDQAQGFRLAAREVEEVVIRILSDALTNPAKLLERLGGAAVL